MQLTKLLPFLLSTALTHAYAGSYDDDDLIIRDFYPEDLAIRSWDDEDNLAIRSWDDDDDLAIRGWDEDEKLYIREELDVIRRALERRRDPKEQRPVTPPTLGVGPEVPGVTLPLRQPRPLSRPQTPENGQTSPVTPGGSPGVREFIPPRPAPPPPPANRPPPLIPGRNRPGQPPLPPQPGPPPSGPLPPLPPQPGPPSNRPLPPVPGPPRRANTWSPGGAPQPGPPSNGPLPPVPGPPRRANTWSPGGRRP